MLIYGFRLAVFIIAFTLVGINAYSSDTISLTDRQIERMGIKTQASIAATDILLADIPAKVVPVRNNIIAVTVPFAGVLTKIHILPGQRVKAGDILFSVRSRDYLEMKTVLDAAKVELQSAKAAFEQQKLLVDEGLASAASLLPLKAELARARAMINEHSSPLRGVSAAGASQYYVKSPASGIVNDFDLVAGQSVEPTNAVSSVYTSDRLWVEMAIPEYLAGQIQIGDKVKFGDGGLGKIISVSNIVDTKTKSASGYATVPKKSGLKRGQLIRVHIAQGVKSAMVKLPGSAIIRIDGQPHIFKYSNKSFTPIAVNIASKSDGYATISADIKPGDMVAVNGLTELKAILLAQRE